MHNTLLRQLRRASIDISSVKDTPWEIFLNSINETYQHFDRDMTLMNRSLDISSKELNELNNKLREENIVVENKVQERTRQLTEEEARLQASINSIEIGYVITNIDLHIITINSAAYKLLIDKSSYNNEIKGADSSIKQLFINIEKEIDIETQIKECIQQGKTIENNEVTCGSNILQIIITPIKLKTDDQDSIIGAVILLEDKTEEKLLQRTRDEFFSIASHELRTPLTAIMGYSSMIQDYYSKDITNPEINKMILNIFKASNSLISIVNDFLDMSRLELRKTQFDYVKINIVDLIKNVVDEYRVTSSRKKLYLNFEPPKEQFPQVFGDINRIKQVLINLVGNGLKFTNNGGVTISVSADEKYAKIYIKDTGSGIPLQNQKLLFRKFQQAGDNIYSRDVSKGTGLGLYISKLIIEDMRGAIALESSQEDNGSTFSITIPVVSAKM